MKETWITLRNMGYRKTRQRMIVIEEVSRGGCLQSAEEILNCCRQREQSISMPTVYRTLEMLVDAGLMRRVNLGQGRAWFEPHASSGDHHHHMVCRQCGRREKITLCPLGIVEQEARSSGFQVDQLFFEVLGRCAACAQKEEAK